MPADPEQTPSIIQAIIGAIGLGGAGIGWRVRQNEKAIEDHGKRITAIEGNQKVLLDRSERAELDRERMLNSLERIEGKLP